MMMDEILRRRSVRKFQPIPVEREKIDLIVEAARLAPSACNLQPFAVLPVSSGRELTFVRGAAYNIGACASAPLIFVCMVDLEADASVEKRIVELVEERAVEPLDMSSLHSVGGNPFRLRLGRDFALVSGAVAVEHMVLQATCLGLGSCWSHHFDHDDVRRYFHIPVKMELLTLLAVGYAAEAPGPRPRKKNIVWKP